MTKPTIHEVEAMRKVERAWHANRIANRIGILKFRVSRKARRRAVHGWAPARDTAWRQGVYGRQNGTEHQAWTNPSRLTAAQRRRIRHKENAARAER